ncbi:hypothetical protein ANCCAN_10473 [Ancylostoma caninum]|uniref:Nucleoporin Nup88 n=1 Tax=Ancylostoma caninum TaxID=29170 RepID=A0A368GGR3_ANCCA|nr:hypothetical protein ANCCAN_10473 [Ancylostoma caninum]
MRTSLSELRKQLNGKNYLISSFRYKNLVIFCDGSMRFVYGLVSNNGYAEYTKLVHVSLSPRVPDEADITSMSITNDGSLIVLSSESDLFLVRVSADLWASKSENYIPLDHYVCELEQVHATLLNSVKPPKVLQTRWILADSFNCSAHFLAVLFDDNRIRMYQAGNICDVPFTVIDYSLFMCASDRPYETPGSNSYGFFKSIVSFDCLSLPEESPVIVAIDSEGEMYATIFSVVGNTQPITRPLIPPSALPCDPIQIKVIEHPMTDIFAVFAVLSSGNVISFVVAVPNEQSAYSLFLHEQLQLPQTSPLSICSTDLEYTVIVASDTSLLHFDLSQWIQEYAVVLQDHSPDVGKSPFSITSTARELINLSTDTGDSAFVGVGENRAVHLICKSVACRGASTIIVACTENPPLATAFLNQKGPEPSWHPQSKSLPESVQSPLNENVLRAIISRKEPLPRIESTKSPKEFVESISNFFSIAHKNQLLLVAALEMSQDRLTALMKFAKQLTEKQNDVNQRLLKVGIYAIYFKVLRQNVALKDKKERLRTDVAKSLMRADRVFARSHDQKLSGEETKLLSALKECRARMLTYAMEASKLSLQAAELQREARGPARPFTASAGASLFVLQHGEEELSLLKRRLDSLSAKMEAFGFNSTDNKENDNPRS